MSAFEHYRKPNLVAAYLAIVLISMVMAILFLELILRLRRLDAAARKSRNSAHKGYGSMPTMCSEDQSSHAQEMAAYGEVLDGAWETDRLC